MNKTINDPTEHYRKNVAPIEHEELDECQYDIKNVGWTLGNACPFHCPQCYSLSARQEGVNLSTKIVDRVVDQLKKNNIQTINLGGNEPFFTNGLNRKDSILHYIISQLNNAGMLIGLTTTGVSAIFLNQDHPEIFTKLNDIDISLDSPYPGEHNSNRGSDLFSTAVEALELAEKNKIDHTIIICAMNWNFTNDRIKAAVELAKKYHANIRINTIKPVEPQHMKLVISPEQFYKGFSLLMKLCESIDLGEPPLASVTQYQQAKGCPCGRTSFRIHSITPDGKMPISPCVYLHDYKAGDLLTEELSDIIKSPQFQAFRRRNAHPEAIVGCSGCEYLEKCKGGCASRSYLHHLHETGERSLFVKDPFCPKEHGQLLDFPQNITINSSVTLVHRDYLCTWIGKPR